VKQFPIVAASVFAVLFLAWLWSQSLPMFIVGAAVGFLIAFFIMWNSRKKSSDIAADESVRRRTDLNLDAEERSIHEQTARANQALRLDPDLAPALLEAFELLIDLIRDLAPKALDRFPDSDMTYDLVELGKSYLPGLAARFLVLSPEDRNNAQEDLLCQLRDLTEVAENTGRALDEGQISNFEAHHDFLKAKFGRV
jgi:hypothetical protein